MFKKQTELPEGSEMSGSRAGVAEKDGEIKTNAILKGSKLRGDINISCDLELSGEVEGNITSDEDANIIIRGTCTGSITTSGGSVAINGKMTGGDIITGGDVDISGKFSGGEIKAGGKISVSGEFNGKLTGKEIELGPEATGSGDLLYRDYISISRGARVEAQIAQSQEKAVREKKASETGSRAPDSITGGNEQGVFDEMTGSGDAKVVKIERTG